MEKQLFYFSTNGLKEIIDSRELLCTVQKEINLSKDRKEQIADQLNRLDALLQNLFDQQDKG
jgi:hypothetical protein